MLKLRQIVLCMHNLISVFDIRKSGTCQQGHRHRQHINKRRTH